VYAGAAKIRKHISAFTNMEAVVTSLSLPPGSRFTMRGTHNGEFFGVPATGKVIVVQAINFYRLANEQITEEYGQPDMLGLLRQIGAIPI
jgi:predicted ester cyclase